MKKWELYPKIMKDSLEDWLNNYNNPLIILGESGVGKTSFVEEMTKEYNYSLKEFNLVEIENMADFKKHMNHATKQINIWQMMYENENNGNVILLDEIDNFIISDKGHFKEFIDMIKDYNSKNGSINTKNRIILTANISSKKNKKLISLYKHCFITEFPNPTLKDIQESITYYFSKSKYNIKMTNVAKKYLIDFVKEYPDYREIERISSDLSNQSLNLNSLKKYLKNIILKEKEHPYQELLQFLFEKNVDLETTFKWAEQEPNLLSFLFHEHLPLIYPWEKYKDCLKDWDKINYLDNLYEEYSDELRNVITTGQSIKLPKIKLTPRLKKNLEKFSESYQRRNLILQRQYSVRNSPILEEDILEISQISLLDPNPEKCPEVLENSLFSKWRNKNFEDADLKLLLRYTIWNDKIKRIICKSYLKYC